LLLLCVLRVRACLPAQVVACKPGLGGAMLPRKCETVDPVTNQACPLNSWVVLGERSKYVDQQTLKLQVRSPAVAAEAIATTPQESGQH
jgi:DNA replication licensing factor MCM5